MFKRGIEDVIFDNFGKILLALIGLLIGLMISTGAAKTKARETFMAECTQHRENYECVAMWRAGDHSSNVTPIPVVIPIR